MDSVSVHSDFGDQGNKICHCFHFFLFYLPWSHLALGGQRIPIQGKVLQNTCFTKSDFLNDHKMAGSYQENTVTWLANFHNVINAKPREVVAFE